MTAAEVRRRRVADRIQLYVVAERAGVSRGRLSEIESGLVTPKPGELDRIALALDSLIEARQQVAEYAAKVGWPMAVA